MIIALDGASTDLSVAIAEADGTPRADEGWSTAQRQSAELLPRLLTLLERSGRHIDEATVVAVGIGPGSFTGLRVAVALGKGLAFGLGIPIVGVPSLLTWLEADPDATGALARAGAREAYVVVRGEPEARIVDREALGPLREARIVAPTELAAAFGLARAEPPRAAGAIAVAAARRLAEAPDGDDLRALEPIYLRPPRGVSGETEAGVRWL